MKCWICDKNEANSCEHRTKKTDLKELFPNTTQKNPVNHKRDGKSIKPIGSLKAIGFKYSKVICEECNNSTTQMHDYAWEELSKYFTQNWESIKKNNGFNLSEVFLENHKLKILYIQLFFIKLFGCKVVESNMDISIKEFSHSIIQEIENTNIYISFRDNKNTISSNNAVNSDIHADSRHNITYAHWFYTVGSFTVDLHFCKNINDFFLNGAKKPSEMGDFISLTEHNYNQDYQQV